MKPQTIFKDFKTTLQKKETEIKKGNDTIWKGEILYLNIFIEYLQTTYNNVKVSEFFYMFSNKLNYTSIKYFNYRVLQEDDIPTDIINEFKNNTKRFMIIPIGILLSSYIGHSNILIIDTVKNEAELFEPYGDLLEYIKPLVFDNTLYYSKINNLLVKLNPKLKFFPPLTFLPVKGFQFLEEKTCPITEKLGDIKVNTYTGFCLLWTMFYVEQRIKNENLTRNVLTKKLFNKIYKKNDSKYICKLIRNYAAFITSLYKSKSFMSKVKLRLKFYQNYYKYLIVQSTLQLMLSLAPLYYT